MLDRKVKLQLLASERDRTGGRQAGAPIENHTVWASKNDTEARNQLLSGREDTVALTTYTINYRRNVDNRWQVVDGDFTYRVTGVLERGRLQYLDLLCEGVK